MGVSREPGRCEMKHECFHKKMADGRRTHREGGNE